MRCVVLFIAVFFSAPGSSATLNEWCAKQGFNRLVQLQSTNEPSWRGFRHEYMAELESLARGLRAEQIDAVTSKAAAEEAAVAALPATTKEEQRALGMARGELRKRQMEDPELRAVAAHLLFEHLFLQRELGASTSGMPLLQALSEKPRDVIGLGIRDSAGLAAHIRDLLPTQRQLTGAVHVLSPAERAQERFLAVRGDKSPTEIREEVKVALTKGGTDEYIDSLVGLNSKELQEQDLRVHGNENHGKEATWMKSGHDFYGSSYNSFPVYDAALKIPPGGKVVDLGAGPFRAGVSFGALRPDVNVVGYELFQTRVDAGNKVIANLGIGDKARMYQKNLSEPNLQLETADGYILMNPFPRDTSKNIFSDLKRVATESNKPFRVLIFSSAHETIEVAKTQSWLKPVTDEPQGRARYGYHVFEAKPAKVNEPDRVPPKPVPAPAERQESWLGNILNRWNPYRRRD